MIRFHEWRLPSSLSWPGDRFLGHGAEPKAVRTAGSRAPRSTRTRAATATVTSSTARSRQATGPAEGLPAARSCSEGLT